MAQALRRGDQSIQSAPPGAVCPSRYKQMMMKQQLISKGLSKYNKGRTAAASMRKSALLCEKLTRHDNLLKRLEAQLVKAKADKAKLKEMIDEQWGRAILGQTRAQLLKSARSYKRCCGMSTDAWNPIQV